MPASLHIGDGFARIGGVTLPARASARGLELGREAVLHPLPFGLRSRLVAWSGDDLPELLLAEMLEGTADGLERLVLQALALHLAGADSGAPSFAASATLVARLLGWPLADINAAEALEIDRLAASLAPSLEQADDGGWTTVLFAEAADASSEDEPLESLCARLTADLKRRAAEGISRSQAAVFSAAPPAFRASAQTPAVPDADGRGLPGDDPGHAASGAAPDNGRPVNAGLVPVIASAATKLDPPPDPWRETRASAIQQPDFGPVSPAATQPTRFAQPLSERGLDAAVWAQPKIDGNPTLAYQAGPEPAPVRHDQPEALANPSPSNVAPAALPSQAESRGTINSPVFPAPGARYPLPEGVASSAALSGTAASAPTRSDLFWQAVAPAATAAHQPASFVAQPLAQPQPLPSTQAAAEPVLNLDGIADALHAIADLRGVAR